MGDWTQHACDSSIDVSQLSLLLLLYSILHIVFHSYVSGQACEVFVILLLVSFCLYFARRTSFRFSFKVDPVTYYTSEGETHTLDAGLLARSQYPEGPVTGHLDTGFSLFPCVYKRMLRWFPSFQVATTCLSCSPPDLNFLVTFFSIFVYM